MMNLTVNLPLIIVTMSGTLTMFYYGYWLRMKTAVSPATITSTQPFVKETK